MDAPLAVSISGRRLVGWVRGAGEPTVILEMGLGAAGDFYDGIARQVAALTRVVSYDRAGLGGSDPAPKPRTIEDFVSDLHLLLHDSAIPGPFVLVGHSLGGLAARLYRERYPAEIAALVLIDAAHEEQQRRFLALLPPESPHESADLARLRHAWSVEWLDPAANEEGIDNVANSAIMLGCGTLGATPLFVISRGRPDREATRYPPGFVEDVEQAWRQMQLELARLSSNSHHVIASKSGHVVNRDEPEVIIAGIRQAVTSVRNP
jgi:pimeloyl-ACP methyl ester carboxylesterase